MKLKDIVQKIKSFLSLSFSLATSEFKLRNEGSYLGILWYLLNPILLFFLLLVVFSNNLGSKIDNYPIYLLLGIIMFNFFQQITNTSILSMKDHKGIIKSINFPKEVIVGSNLLKSLFSHFFEIILFFIIAGFMGVNPIGFLYYLPILFFYCIFIIGCTMILSSLYVYFTDLDNIWQFFSRLLFFGTPIVYSIVGMKKTLILNLFNPLYYFITIARDTIIYNKIPETWMVIIAIIYSLITLLIGSIIFNKLKVRFAELL